MQGVGFVSGRIMKWTMLSLNSSNWFKWEKMPFLAFSAWWKPKGSKMHVNSAEAALEKKKKLFLWLHIKISICSGIKSKCLRPHYTRGGVKLFGNSLLRSRSTIFNFPTWSQAQWSVIEILTACTKETVIEVLTLMRPPLPRCSFV